MESCRGASNLKQDGQPDIRTTLRAMNVNQSTLTYQMEYADVSLEFQIHVS